MLKSEELFMIKAQKSKGLTISQIAKEMGITRKTATKWANANELPKYKRKPIRSGKLDSFKDYILNRMEEGCINAVIIHDEILEKGYQGKLTVLREFMKPHREKALSKASIRYETPPGKQAQVDWGEFWLQHPDGMTVKVHAFVMTMGHSRAMYLEFTENQKFETLIGCHDRAFAYLGGVPETILYDNMKTVVKYSHKAGADKWNDRFLRYAVHMDFNPTRHRPYHPRSKGKVENGVKYVRRNFWPRLRQVCGLVDLNSKAQLWLDTKCNLRLHQTTRKIPLEALKTEPLRPVNPEPFLSADLQTRRVLNDCMVSYEANYYSVPHSHVGSRVGIRDLRNGCLQIYDAAGKLITTHVKQSGKYQIRKKKKHFEGLRSGTQKKVAGQAPILIPDPSPKVHQRPLGIYDSLIDEALS